MSATPSASTRRPRRQRLVAGTAAALLVVALAGCGAKGGSEASSSSGDTKASDTTASTGGDTPAATTTTTAAPKAISDSDLEGALPTAADVGEPYRLSPKAEDDPSSASDDTDKAIEEACPEAAEFFKTTGKDNKDDITAEFSADDGRSIETAVTRDTSAIPEDKVDEIVKALNACKEIKTTDADGATLVGTIAAQRIQGLGDYALGVDFEFKVGVPQAGISIDVSTKGILFVEGDLGGSVLVVSGFDQDSLSSVPADTDKLQPLSEQIAQNLADLQD